MSWGNRYFEFDEPIRWFKAIGHSASNSYYGASRLIDTVHEATEIRPGDQVHALVGGTFVVRADGTVETGRLRLPKPAFEKTYGIYDTDASLLERMAKCGRCREIPAPAGKPDYNSARKAVDVSRLPELMGNVAGKNNADPSPLLRNLLEAAAEADLGTAVQEAGAKWYRIDVGQGSQPDSLECAVRIDLPDGKRISVAAVPTERELWVRDDTRKFGEALKAADAADHCLTPEYRNEVVTIVPEGEAMELMFALSKYVVEGRIPAPAAPRP